jgi:hypothetical protein
MFLFYYYWVFVFINYIALYRSVEISTNKSIRVQLEYNYTYLIVLYCIGCITNKYKFIINMHKRGRAESLYTYIKKV